jgi:hypothetical protein
MRVSSVSAGAVTTAPRRSGGDEVGKIPHGRALEADRHQKSSYSLDKYLRPCAKRTTTRSGDVRLRQ